MPRETLRSRRRRQFRGRRSRRSGLAVALAGCCALLPAPDLLAGRSLDDAVYSRDQARSGKKLYGEHCIACHDRGYFREVLRTRRGETLEPMFDVMVTEMPQNAPGSLADDEYVAIIAYMLSQSRYASGDSPLRVSDLGEILIPAGD